MTRTLIALLFGVVVMSAPADAAAPDVGRRYALIIGVPTGLRNPDLPKLNFVINDVEKLEQLLDREGYEVRTVRNTQADRKRILEELYSYARQLTERDTFVLYYAGHGLRNVEVNRKTYWLTYDAEIEMLDVQGIRLEHLMSYIADIRARRKLILLDHCFSGDVEGILTASSRPTATAPVPIAVQPKIVARSAAVVGDLNGELNTASEGTLIIAAARDLAYELKDLRHGVFTQALLDACRLPQGSDRYKRSLPSLVTFIKARVERLLKDASAPTQVPVDRASGSIGSMNWPFCTVLVPKNEVTAAANAYAAAIQAWETKGLLSARRRIVCAAVLDKWKAAGGDTLQLERTDSRVLAAIRLHADPEDLSPEEARAATLNDALDGEGFQ